MKRQRSAAQAAAFVSGAEELRICVSNLNVTRESFNSNFTAEQLLQISRMHRASEWDIFPDCWTGRQINEALRGLPPQWTDRERPSYARKGARS